MKPHLYGITFGKGDLEGHVIRRVDNRCHLVKVVSPDDYTTYDPAVEWASRLELERQLAQDPIAVSVEARRYVAHDVIAAADLAYAEGSSDQFMRHRLRWFQRSWLAVIALTIVVGPRYDIEPPGLVFVAALVGGPAVMWIARRLLRSLGRDAIAGTTEEIVRSLKLDPVAELQVLDRAKNKGFDLAGTMLTQRLQRA